MPYVNIFRGGRQVETKEFSKQFIISGHKVLFWRADEDEDWTTDKENRETLDKLTGAYLQLILTNTHKGYEISSILPTWDLWVNQEKCERGFYSDTLINWHKVKLLYKDYEFVFVFEQEEKRDENAPLPKPLLYEAQIDGDYWDRF